MAIFQGWKGFGTSVWVPGCLEHFSCLYTNLCVYARVCLSYNMFNGMYKCTWHMILRAHLHAHLHVVIPLRVFSFFVCLYTDCIISLTILQGLDDSVFGHRSVAPGFKPSLAMSEGCFVCSFVGRWAF